MKINNRKGGICAWKSLWLLTLAFLHLTTTDKLLTINNKGIAVVAAILYHMQYQ